LYIPQHAFQEGYKQRSTAGKGVCRQKWCTLKLTILYLINKWNKTFFGTTLITLLSELV
jgi:hypothetical protein